MVSVKQKRQNHIDSYRLLAAHAVGVSSGSLWMDKLARPGRTAARYSRARILSRRQVSTMERIAATHGVLRKVVAQLQLCIVEEASELVPQPKGVGRCLTE